MELILFPWTLYFLLISHIFLDKLAKRTGLCLLFSSTKSATPITRRLTSNSQPCGGHRALAIFLSLNGLTFQESDFLLAAFLTTSCCRCRVFSGGLTVFLSSVFTPQFSRADPTWQARPFLSF